MEQRIGATLLHVIQDDITRVAADAIVNAANQSLAGGGGVDGAIHRVGGASIMAECRRIGRCSVGDAVVTGAGDLPARFVIHAVAPIWQGGTAREAELLRSAYSRSLQVAEEAGAATIAFPSLGTGAYGYPIEEAAGIALTTVTERLRRESPFRVVTFVLFSPRDQEVYEKVLKSVL